VSGRRDRRLLMPSVHGPVAVSHVARRAGTDRPWTLPCGRGSGRRSRCWSSADRWPPDEALGRWPPVRSAPGLEVSPDQLGEQLWRIDRRSASTAGHPCRAVQFASPYAWTGWSPVPLCPTCFALSEGCKMPNSSAPRDRRGPVGSPARPPDTLRRLDGGPRRARLSVGIRNQACRLDASTTLRIYGQVTTGPTRSSLVSA